MALKGQGSKQDREAPPVPENWVINSDNQYLFRDNMAYSRYVGGVINREITQCYYFKAKPFKKIPRYHELRNMLTNGIGGQWSSVIHPTLIILQGSFMQTLGYLRIHSCVPPICVVK